MHRWEGESMDDTSISLTTSFAIILPVCCSLSTRGCWHILQVFIDGTFIYVQILHDHSPSEIEVSSETARVERCASNKTSLSSFIRAASISRSTVRRNSLKMSSLLLCFLLLDRPPPTPIMLSMSTKPMTSELDKEELLKIGISASATTNFAL